MAKAPIEMMMDDVKWVAIETPSESDDGIPHATHHGVFHLFGVDLQCYQLADGQRIIDEDSMAKFFEAMGNGEINFSNE